MNNGSNYFRIISFFGTAIIWCFYIILQKKMKRLMKVNYTFLTVLTIDILASAGDSTITWTSPVLPKLYSTNAEINPLGRPITKDEESWIGSLLSIGAVVGFLPFTIISEKFGRKLAILFLSLPIIISFLLLAFVANIYVYYVARFIAGSAVGGIYVLLPMYVAEVAEDSNRGMLSVTLNIFWTFGNLLSYILGPYMPILTFNIVLAAVPSLFFVLFSLIAPETPYYLVRKSEIKKAEKSLMKLRSGDRGDVSKELMHIQYVVENDQNGSVLDLFKTKASIKALAVSLILVILQQLTGINAVLFYTQLIFESSGSDVPADISSIIIGLILFFSSIVPALIADKFGRRLFLIVSATGMVIAHVVFGVYFYLKDSTPAEVGSFSWLPILSLVLYISMYNFGFGSIVWTVTSELFPLSVKSAAASLISMTCWLISFLVTKFFNDMNDHLGVSGTFWVFAGFCFIALLFCCFCVPETKGKSFKDIQDLLSK